MDRASAADLKFLQRLLQLRLGNFRSKSGTGIIGLLVPFAFRSSCKRLPAMTDELRKAGTRQ